MIRRQYHPLILDFKRACSSNTLSNEKFLTENKSLCYTANWSNWKSHPLSKFTIEICMLENCVVTTKTIESWQVFFLNLCERNETTRNSCFPKYHNYAWTVWILFLADSYTYFVNLIICISCMKHWNLLCVLQELCNKQFANNFRFLNHIILWTFIWNNFYWYHTFHFHLYW